MAPERQSDSDSEQPTLPQRTRLPGGTSSRAGAEAAGVQLQQLLMELQQLLMDLGATRMADSGKCCLPQRRLVGAR